MSEVALKSHLSDFLLKTLLHFHHDDSAAFSTEAVGVALCTYTVRGPVLVTDQAEHSAVCWWRWSV